MEGKRESKAGAATSGKWRRGEEEGEKRGSVRLDDLGGPAIIRVGLHFVCYDHKNYYYCCC